MSKAAEESNTGRESYIVYTRARDIKIVTVILGVGIKIRVRLRLGAIVVYTLLV